jgi:ankyrin repeat protein
LLAEQKELARLEEERKRQEKREAKELAKIEKRKKIIADRVAKKRKYARTPRNIEGMYNVDDMLAISPHFFSEHAEKVSKERYTRKSFGRNTRDRVLVAANTNALMIYSAITQSTEQLSALLKAGIDINETNERGFSALHFATAYNTPKIVNYLIEQGADINVQSETGNMNILHTASYLNPNPDMIKLLVSKNFSLEEIATQGYTPLLIASESNQNLEIAETLAKLGADKKVYVESGLTAYGLARRRVEEGYDPEYIRISKEYDQLVLDTLKD